MYGCCILNVTKEVVRQIFEMLSRKQRHHRNSKPIKKFNPKGKGSYKIIFKKIVLVNHRAIKEVEHNLSSPRNGIIIF